MTSPFTFRRLKAFKKGLQDNRSAFQAGLIEGNGWIFSKMKSGTTQLCNVLAFYRNAQHGDGVFDFSDLARFGVVRLAENDPSAVGKSIAFASQTSERVYFQTHNFHQARPAHLILQSRNVLDYCVSSFFFHYQNRKSTSGTNVDKALKNILSQYIACHKGQIRAAQNAGNVHTFYYEDTREAELQAFEKLIQALDGVIDTPALKFALDAASPAKLKAYETRIGHAAVAAKGTFKKPHFVRSGAVGEGQEFFNEAQREFIFETCASQQVPTDGRLDL